MTLVVTRQIRMDSRQSSSFRRPLRNQTCITERAVYFASERIGTMKLIIIPHNVTLTEAIEKHVVGKIEKLDHFDKRAIDARVTLEHDHTRAPERQFSCSMRLSVRGPDLFAEDREEDL